MNKRILISFGMIFLIGILMVNFISAADPLYCCERLKNNGAWCQDAVKTQCATGVNPFSKTNEIYKQVATLCESTSYCKLGTCVNPLQGSCMPNTPQVVCNNEKGVWKAGDMSELPECQLGCCLLGNEIAFVTLTQCKKLSADFGLETNYRADIQSELECIASVTSDEMGACVYEEEYQKTCRMTTQTDCQKIDGSEFHIGYLCSAQQLATNCGPSKETVCVGEQVYFMDTCGNPANIYDASKINDNNNYWTYIQEPSCDDGNGNKNSKTCGACDYFSGSTCKAYDTTNAKPSYGNYICSSLDCTYNGKAYLHGETWCADNSKSDLIGKNLPGSRYFRMMCYDGEVTAEPCAEYRNEVCRESEVEGFSSAACTINRWQECTLQINKTDCEDTYARDCKWINGYSILKDTEGKDLGFTGIAPQTIPGSCVPKYAPGFDFWVGEGTGSERCSFATSTCVVKYEIWILGDKSKLETNWKRKISACVENCYCLPGYTNGAAKAKYENNKPPWHPKSYDAWIKQMNDICTSLGDCGNKKNYLGLFGENKTVFTSEFIKKP